MHTVESNKSTVDSFTQSLQSTKDTAFEATYTTTGGSPATIVYAVDPSSGGLAFHETQTGSNPSNIQLIVNSSGEYKCSSPSASGGPWSCQKLGTADAATENKIFDVYTPSHWISFLKGVSLVAGLAGDKVTTSTMSLNGFDMNCVDLVAKGEPGTSTICSTSQGILGYVKRCVGVDDLPDHELLVVALGIAVPVAARRHRHDVHHVGPTIPDTMRG